MRGVHVIHMAGVRHRIMPAAIAVLVGVAFVPDMDLHPALIPVLIMGAMHVAVVEVVGMVAVRYQHVAAASPMLMGMRLVGLVSAGH